MKVMVTGGAGYIGSHAVRCLLDAGHSVVVLDDLSHGHIAAVDPRAIFIQAETGDTAKVRSVIREYSIDAVLHFAAFIEVGESVIDPAKYYYNNFSGTLSLLEAMRAEGVKKIVFSSTAAVYGAPKSTPIEESQELAPINPYGRSKMMSEFAIEDFSRAYGLGYAILRYFNVAGAHPEGHLGEDHHPESHLIPRILFSLRENSKEPARIFGTDYPTPDGTCVRDYVHVVDLANAHILALEKIIPGKGNVYNIGSEKGFSVREVIEACSRVTGKKINVEEGPRRAGDPAVLVASSRKIQLELGWKPQYSTMESIVSHAWTWHSKNPNGYARPETPNLSVTLKEDRLFNPTAAFTAQANLAGEAYRKAVETGRKDPEGYWAQAARELLWRKPFTRVLEWKPPFAKWFYDGKLNAAENCLDRHLSTRSDKVAITWEGEPDGESVRWTYAELHDRVVRLSAALRKLGVSEGDKVAIYLPLVPESTVAMLACARIGATHTVVFGGFAADALKDRMNDAEAKVLITADYGWRKGMKVPLRENAVRAVEGAPSVESVITLRREDVGAKSSKHGTESMGSVGSAKEYDFAGLLWKTPAKDLASLGGCAELDAEHPLFILYTSGTTGKPKGIVHSTGGFLTGAMRSTRDVFDLKDSDLYWCTADIGWVTGHTYVVYGPLSLGASIFLYEGAPTTPGPDRFWQMIEKHRISILYTAPTAIRAFMKLGDEHPKKHNLGSLRVLGTVGEPINPEAWMWYRDVIGGGRCPIVDTYWQTETGSIVISPVPGVTPSRPGTATLPLPGYDVDILDKGGNPVPIGNGGYLVIKKPWPSMARTIHKDPERFAKTYFSDYKNGVYFTGDGARRDELGYIWCLGRVDDVLNVSGHRLGTMEIESALVSHPSVAEAAVVGRPDELKGQAIVSFVSLKSDVTKSIGKDYERLTALKNELRAHVTREIGALARPDDIRFTDGLPKTRSGKIMRRLLRELATNGEVKGDTTTLEDLNVIAALQSSDEE